MALLGFRLAASRLREAARWQLLHNKQTQTSAVVVFVNGCKTIRKNGLPCNLEIHIA